MIIPLAGVVVGALIGAFSAKRRGGKPADMAQWAAVFAIIFGLAGLFILIFLTRTAG